MFYEGYGKYLDLHAVHTMYINIKGAVAIDYVAWLSSFDAFAEVPKAFKAHGTYKKYVQALSSTLENFLARSRPLLDIAKELKRIDEEFVSDWADEMVLGWQRSARGTSKGGQGLLKGGSTQLLLMGATAAPIVAAAPVLLPVDVNDFATVDELCAVDPARLKLALQALGLKCGGTVLERANRLFVTKGVSANTLDKSLLAPEAKKQFEDGGRSIAGTI